MSVDPLNVKAPSVGSPTEDGTSTAAPTYDTWSLGRTRLVAFKAERMLTEAQRELGAFGAGTLATPAAPELLRASEHVSEALAVLEELQATLRSVAPG
jgi:hypothetical protein